jgi:hypothetical protein
MLESDEGSGNATPLRSRPVSKALITPHALGPQDSETAIDQLRRANSTARRCAAGVHRPSVAPFPRDTDDMAKWTIKFK